MGGTTIYTLGYQGWGTAGRELRRAVDAVERARGSKPPVFVDVRRSRSARARDFSGPAFERLVGKRRYRWVRELGNEESPLGDAPPARVGEPAAAKDLLDMALEEAGDDRHVVVFSSCPFPKEGGKVECHRHTIANLLVREAKRRGVDVTVAEWPGGEPEHRDVRVDEDVLDAVRGGRKSVPVGKGLPKDLVGLAWGSVVTLRAGDAEVHRVVGPAQARSDGWALPVLWPEEGGEPTRAQCERKQRTLRRKLGVEPRST